MTALWPSGHGLISATDSAASTSYFLSDGMGSTTELADPTGMVTDRYQYDVFGAVRNTPTSTNDFRFTGEQQDLDARRDLLYLRARHYDPTLGRFLQRDPAPLLQRYAYAGNNPVTFSDPLGLEAIPFPSHVGPSLALFTALAYAIQQLTDCSAGNSATCNMEIFAVHRAEWDLVNWFSGEGAATAGGSEYEPETEAEDSPQEAKPWYEQKIADQLEPRGWTPDDVEEAIQNPADTHPAKDWHGGREPEPATGYEHPNGGYVIVNDRTGEVIQVSDRNNPDWQAPWDRQP